MNFKKGDIILRSDTGEIGINNPFLFWERSPKQNGFIGLCLFAQMNGNVSLTQEHIVWMEPQNLPSYFLNLLLILKNEWGPFEKVGHLSKTGLDYVESHINSDAPIPWDNWISQVNSAECDRILAWTEKIKKHDFREKFSVNDTRRAFVEMISDSAYRYYLGIAFLEMMRLSSRNLFQYNIELRYFDPHINRLTETTRVGILEKSQFNYLNRSLLLDSWSSFELCCTIFVESLASEEEKDKLLTHQFRNLQKKLPKGKLTAQELLDLKQALSTNSLVHVPIVRKYDVLFNKCENYSGVVQDDKDFLKFVGKFRNTVHSNFIYHGTDYDYILNGVHFKFRDRKAVVWTDRTTKVYFDLLDRLLEVWGRLCEGIEFSEICKHPHK